MLTPKRITWFLIADGAKARLFESAGPKAEFTLKNEWSAPDARTPSRELGRDRPARGRNIGTGAPYAVDVPSPHNKAEEEFLTDGALDLNDAHKRDEFDQLLIAAPPTALGLLRKKLAPDVIAKLIGVLDKDLTYLPENDLHAYLLEALERW